MGGPGSGRPRTNPLVVRVSHEERRQLRYQIAVYAVSHGVRAAVDEFAVAEHTVRRSLWENRMRPAREVPSAKLRAGAIYILKRLLIDRETADVAAAAVGVTVTYARAVQRAAQAAGFIFEDTTNDSRQGANAEAVDSGERGEESVVG